MGEHETAEEVKKLPNTVNEIKENVTAETANVFTGAMVDLNEERKQAVENEKDPYLKMVINLIFLTVIIQFGIAILVLFGIKVK
ncbi:MAG: hypothetical protein KKA58_02945 [Nanoarchaeota archaeon]|nr:hypothetical protein [Nanoarchaeota archaeon]MBU1876046.1 hypothetical protein [Nanoarchaeota archaeon]